LEVPADASHHCRIVRIEDVAVLPGSADQRHQIVVDLAVVELLFEPGYLLPHQRVDVARFVDEAGKAYVEVQARQVRRTSRPYARAGSRGTGLGGKERGIALQGDLN